MARLCEAERHIENVTIIRQSNRRLIVQTVTLFFAILIDSNRFGRMHNNWARQINLRRREISLATSTVDAIDNRQPSDASYAALTLFSGETLFTYANFSNFGNLTVCRNLLRTATHSHTRQLSRNKHRSYNVISATRTERYSQIHDTQRSHTHAN